MKKDIILGCLFSFYMPLCSSSCDAVTAHIFIFYSLTLPFSRRTSHNRLHKKFPTWWITSLNTSPYFALAISTFNLPLASLTTQVHSALSKALVRLLTSTFLKVHFDIIYPAYSRSFFVLSSPGLLFTNTFTVPSLSILRIWPSHYSLHTFNTVTIIQIS
jgi:hypothetical protein